MDGASDPSVSVPQLRFVITGDADVGKTCAILAFSSGADVQEYDPSAIGCYSRCVEINDQKVAIVLQDTAGSESYVELRVHAYRGADAVVVFFEQ